MGIRCADHVTTFYPQKLALTSPTGGGRSVGIVRSRTKAIEFSFSLDNIGLLTAERVTRVPRSGYNLILNFKFMIMTLNSRTCSMWLYDETF